APYKVEEKELGWTDIFAAPAGSPSIETMGPALWDAAFRGVLTINRVVELLSERPAEIFGLAGRKGFIRPGADADFVLLDPKDTWTVRAEEMFSRSKASARLFEGRTLQGRIRATYLRGAAAYESGQIRNQPGAGQFVRPEH
ncbi:MAG: amidohydrolase family protein, partial [Candidatus Limnocylindria bacterium]